MPKFAIGDRVRLFGKPGILNSAVVVGIDTDTDFVLVRFVDETTEWFSAASLNADYSQIGGSSPIPETQKVNKSLEN